MFFNGRPIEGYIDDDRTVISAEEDELAQCEEESTMTGELTVVDCNEIVEAMDLVRQPKWLMS